MIITQDTVKDSLDIKFSNKSNEDAPSLSIKQGANGEAVIELNSVPLGPGSSTEGPITLWNQDKTYSNKQLVVVSGEIYRSLHDKNKGHNPETDKTNWVKLEHVIEYSTTLPEANEKSVTFVEINGQLYYKTILDGGYLYKKVSSEAGPDTSGISDVIVDNKSVVQNGKAWITSAIKIYDALFPYNKDDLVLFAGKIWKSRVNNNIGNTPRLSEEWLELTNSFYHAEELPEASVDTPSFIEYQGDLYYKVENHSGKYVSFSYVKSSAGSQNADSLEYYNPQTTYNLNRYIFYSGKVYQSLVDNNKGNIPEATDSSYWKLLTFSTQRLLKSDVEFTTFNEHTLYEIIESKTYTDPTAYDFSHESKRAGWKVTEYGVENPISRMSVSYAQLPNEWSNIHELLDYSADGPLAIAYNEAGTLVCRYKKPFINTYTSTICIYNRTLGLVTLASSAEKLYTPLTIVCDNFTTESTSASDIQVWDLTDIDIADLAEAFLETNQAYISTSDNSLRSSVIQASSSNTTKKISTILNNILINYTKDGGTVSREIVELKPSILELTSETGQLSQDELTDSTIIKFTDSLFNDYYLRKTTETQDQIIYSCDDYKMIVNTNDWMYEINENDSSVVTLETSYIGIENNSRYYQYPDLSFSSISWLAAKIASKPVVIKVNDEVFKIASIVKKSGDYDIYILTLIYYNEYLNDDVIVTYESSGLETKINMKPMHEIIITRYDNGSELTGTLPASLIDIFKHGDNPTRTIVRFEQGDEWAPKISNLKYEYREDKEYFYMNNEFACQISARDFSYVIVALS